MTRPPVRVGAWLAILGLLLQVALGAVHSAHHFDHLVGNLVPTASLGSPELSSDTGSPSPSPAAPIAPNIDRCAVGLGLAASGSFVLPAAGIVPLPPVRETVRLEGEAPALAASARRHLYPPARAPPVVAISL